MPVTIAEMILRTQRQKDRKALRLLGYLAFLGAVLFVVMILLT